MNERSAKRSWGGYLGALAAGVAILACGCQESKYAVSTLERDTNERATRRVLTPEEQKEVLAAMKSVAVGHTPAFNRNRMTHGMRWSDIPAAVAAACDEEGVEMVVYQQVDEPWGILFHMRTADDRPAELEVHRTHDARIYEASANVGRFDKPLDQARAKRLLEELDRAMARYGEKRRLPDEPAPPQPAG